MQYMYLQIVVDDLKIGELGKRVVRRQRPLHHELDLPRVSLETVSDLKTDSPHDYVHQVLNLRMRGCKFELKYGTYPGRRKVPLHSFISYPLLGPPDKGPKFQDDDGVASKAYY